MSWEKVDDKTFEMLKEQKAFEDEKAKRLTVMYNSLKTPSDCLFIELFQIP